MNDDTKIKIAWAMVVAIAILSVATLLFRMQITTHASHVKDLEYKNQQMLACIQTDRTAADCRMMLYGSM